MTIRQDAARMFANRIIGAGGVLHYKTKKNPAIEDFVNRQELPKRVGPDTTSKSNLSEHQQVWTKFFMAFAREYPEEQAEHDRTKDQFRY